MPLLELEPTIQPDNLFELPMVPTDDRWWVLHTRPRAEKMLARRFSSLGTKYFLPLYSRDWRKNGRRFQSFLPLFPGYVFLRGDVQDRLSALETNQVAHVLTVNDQQQLHDDLLRVHNLLVTGAPVTPEDRLQPGDRVRIVGGPLAGFEGKILKRGKQLRFVIEVHFLRRAVSADVESWMIQSLLPSKRCVAQVA